MKDIILASNSPRRKALFSLFGWPFVVAPADIDESRFLDEHAVDYVRRLACEKAAKVAEAHHGLIIAADTIVVDGEELLGKPGDSEEARKMLQSLRNRSHHVYTGIALVDTQTDQTYDDVSCTEVMMRNYSDQEIENYIASGDPMDKAGAYAIQHPGFHPAESLTGCYASVMGMPICLLATGLKTLGFEIPAELQERCQKSLNIICPRLDEICLPS